jgi:pSer/pThr/pTyr-binding forkhead associated (FHA) protein
MPVPETPFELVVVRLGVEVRHPLSKEALTIGRSRAAMPDIEIADADAAPRHCVVQWNTATGCHAMRVFGASGAWLNGALLQGDGAPHPLAPGDEFRIGASLFRYRATQAVRDADGEATVDVPTVHAAPTSREVYEFEVIPRIGRGGFDWTRALVSHGPRLRIEAPIQAVRVAMTKGATRAEVVAALKHIADLVEASAGGGTSAAPLVTLSRWFDE